MFPNISNTAPPPPISIKEQSSTRCHSVSALQITHNATVQVCGIQLFTWAVLATLLCPGTCPVAELN